MQHSWRQEAADRSWAAMLAGGGVIREGDFFARIVQGGGGEWCCALLGGVNVAHCLHLTVGVSTASVVDGVRVFGN